jgi:hypothetical protein
MFVLLPSMSAMGQLEIIKVSALCMMHRQLEPMVGTEMPKLSALQHDKMPAFIQQPVRSTICSSDTCSPGACSPGEASPASEAVNSIDTSASTVSTDARCYSEEGFSMSCSHSSLASFHNDVCSEYMRFVESMHNFQTTTTATSANALSGSLAGSLANHDSHAHPQDGRLIFHGDFVDELWHPEMNDGDYSCHHEEMMYHMKPTDLADHQDIFYEPTDLAAHQDIFGPGRSSRHFL